MVFSSLVFIFAFFPLTMILYFLMPTRTTKNLLLLIASLLFYAWGEPIYIILMLISTVNDYTFSRLIDRSQQNGEKRKAKLFLVASLIVNLGLLAFFKYSGFFVDNISALFGFDIEAHSLPLPIGISFYTFQTMSYTIDVYMGNVKVQRNFLTLATYVSMFPQLIAGPIVRYSTIAHELEHRKESMSMVVEGLRRFIIGLAKKVILANPMGLIADTIYSGELSIPGTSLLWLAAVAYTFQIYYDFSGYSDMAIGIGRMFGFHFLENFNYPYIAKSITDFWRRWHISLSTWFKDYVYIPLGGNRNHIYRNIFIVWFLTGLWHGASWNYVLWGLYYGILLLIEKTWLSKILVKLPKILQHSYALIIVVFGWVIFRLEDFTMLSNVITGMFVYTPVDKREFLLFYGDMLYALPYLPLAFIFAMPFPKEWMERIKEQKVVYNTGLLTVLILCIIFLVGGTFNPFIYYRF